jgi:uncharacterized protein (DUF488 family)
VIYTIGHGSRCVEELLRLLREHDVACLVDVRAHPASRRHPQFGRAALERSMKETGIRYVWEGKSLGGRRGAVAGSPHLALADPGLRAYADYMATAAFRDGVKRLLGLGRAARTAVMCAERLPARCHRSFIADSLVAAGERVVHLIGAGTALEHALHPAARLREGRLVYDGAAQGELKL